MGYIQSMKQKTSIALSKDVVNQLDRRARAEGVTRSELIQRACDDLLAGPHGGWHECWKLSGRPSQVVAAFKELITETIDDYGPVQLVWRVPRPAWEEWLKRPVGSKG